MWATDLNQNFAFSLKGHSRSYILAEIESLLIGRYVRSIISPFRDTANFSTPRATFSIDTPLPIKTRAVLSPGNRAKPCKFRYVKSVRNFMWKLCYRKDDRAMRPIRGCPENCRDSLTTPTATIPKIFHELFVLWMILHTLKSAALLVPEIIGGTQKILAAPRYAHAPFFPIFLWAFIRIGPVNVLAKFKVHSFTLSRDNRGYPKIGQPLDTSTLHFLQNF